MTEANVRMPEILESIERIGKYQLHLSRMRDVMQRLREMAMATEQDLKNEIDGLRQLIIADQENDQKAVDALDTAINAANDQIQFLKDELEKAGTPVPPAVNFDDLIASIQQVKTLIVPVTSSNSAPVDPTLPPGETPVPPGTASFS